MTTLLAGTPPMLVTCTVYSRILPGCTVPPPTTMTDLLMASCCTLPTAICVGWLPLLLLPSLSVSSGACSVLVTVPWLVMMSPATPVTVNSTVTVAVAPTARLPMASPPTNGDVGPGASGMPAPFNVAKPAL